MIVTIISYKYNFFLFALQWEFLEPSDVFIDEEYHPIKLALQGRFRLGCWQLGKKVETDETVMG